MLDAISVVIPTYGRPEFLSRAIESALKQTQAVLEVIVVDDGSPDPVVPFIESGVVRIIRLSANRGANAARNAGIDAAQGNLIAFLDDDDEWLPTKLERQLAAMRAQGAGACLCGYEHIGSPGTDQVRNTNTITAADVKQMRQIAGFSALLVDAQLVRMLRLDESLPNAQDWDLYVRLISSGSIAYVPEKLYRFRRGHQSITTKARRANLADLELRATTLRKHRHWIGEWTFRNRLAENFVSHLRQRKDPWAYVWHSVRVAGLLPTTIAFWRAILRNVS